MSHKQDNCNNRLHHQWLNLADERLGTKVLYATDDFFAEKENLIKPGRGIFIADKYTDRGKWMDGWESRRKRTPGHDFCVVKLGTSGKVYGLDIDTNHFLGNHPPFASVEGALADNWEKADWREILPKSPLQPGSQNLFDLKGDGPFNLLRLHIYPDGGVARLRVYGKAEVDWLRKDAVKPLDLLAAENGGWALTCNDMFFSAVSNLIMPGRGVNMGDGWETKRRRTPGHDWAVLRLGHAGKISTVVVDTAHFKGNYPDRCSLEGVYWDKNEELPIDKVSWQLLLPEQKLAADTIHEFSKELQPLKAITHVRFNIFPDGGVSRLRLMGTLA